MNSGPRSNWMRVVLAALILLFSACARTSVNSGRMLNDGASLPRPQLVLIQDYDVGADIVKLDSAIGAKLIRGVSGKDNSVKQLELGKAIAKSLSEKLASDIEKLGLEAKRSSGALPESGGPYLVIRGELLSVNEGNRLRRAVIGLGAGATEVAARTRVVMLEDGKETPVDEFTVSAKSARTPGAAESLGVGAAVDFNHNMKDPLKKTKHTHLEQAAVATGAQHVAKAAGAKMSDTVGDSVQADGARGAKAIVEELTKLLRAREWISATHP